MIPKFIQPYKPSKKATPALLHTLSNWTRTHEHLMELKTEMLNQGSDFDPRIEKTVGALLYLEMQGRRRIHMVSRLKGRLYELVNRRQDNEIRKALGDTRK